MKKVFFAILITTSMAMLSVFGAFAAPANTQALIITRTPLRPLHTDTTKATLSGFYKREQNFLNSQTTHLQSANNLAATVQELIDAAKAEGKDTSGLEAVLAQFNAAIAQAQSSHDNAANILGAHNGFDNNGNVTDIQAAHQTLLDARVPLRNAHGLIVQAVTTLRQAVINWRQAH